jgi:hypothetical protein
VARRILGLGLQESIILAIFAGERKSRIPDPRNRVFHYNFSSIAIQKIVSEKKVFGVKSTMKTKNSWFLPGATHNDSTQRAPLRTLYLGRNSPIVA